MAERKRIRVGCWALVAVAAAGACTSGGGVGDPCLPEEEYDATFSGFALSEVSVETASLGCESRLCLVNHFQGRVSCPFGQRQSDLALPGTAPERCRVPQTTGDRPEDSVGVPVPAWSLDRPRDAAVYCSCRCDGPDRNARYCDCPEGFTCEPLVPDLATATDRQLVGSYCVRHGTRFDRTAVSGEDCGTTPEDERCPLPAGVNP